MSLTMLFLLGIANFALHKAVLESGHPMLARLPSYLRTIGGRGTLVTEFAVLLSAMLLTVNVWPPAIWAYAVYTALNALSAWMILTDRL